MQVHTHRHAHDGAEHVHIHLHADGHTHPKAHAHLHAAFGIGTLHGLAGSSHFLGVLPALAFPEWSQAVTYLAAYGVGTVVSMMVFAAGVGRIAAHADRRGSRGYRNLLATCSAAAVAVGCVWLLP
jgi:cytochrome c biogenesis protein CcdA